MESQDTANANDLSPVGKGEYVVQPGDGVESVAYEHGFFWQTLWNHSDNAEVKQARKVPNVLLPGDRLHIPEIRKKHVSAAPEETHKFRRKGVPAELKIQLKKKGKPRANLKYTLDIDGNVRQGQTDGEGWIKEKIPPNARQGQLRLNGGSEVHVLALGAMNPIDAVSGQKMRLKNLGYYSGHESEEVTTAFQAAVRAFQRDQGIDPSGECDSATTDKLKNAHGS